MTTRGEVKRGVYRLLDTASDDPAMTEHDPPGEQEEALNDAVQEGLWDAQLWFLQKSRSDRWVTTVDWPSGSPDGSWQGSESDDGGRWAALPDDFLRLAGDRERSAFRQPTGTKWGTLLTHEERFNYRGNYYWLQNEDLWIVRGASPPNNLMLDYHHLHADLTDDSDTIDFPKADWKLIVAYAAAHALEESWVIDDGAMHQKVQRNLHRRKQRARARARSSREPRHTGHSEVHGSHFFA